MQKTSSVCGGRRVVFCVVILVCCLILAVVDGYLRPPYAVKAAGKVVLFLVIPLLCTYWMGRTTVGSQGKPSDRHGQQGPCENGREDNPRNLFFSVFRPDRRALTIGLALGVGTMVVILGGYALLSAWLDLSAIPAAMEANGGITADNFLWVGLYVALCNSLLEEIFFRGFAFLTLRRVSSRGFAYVVSAAAFSLYHAAIVDGWVSPLLFGLMLAALFVCGLFFNWLDESRGRIWVSWLMHMCANLAINTIGMRLLGMI